jgi:hypothetical protein
MLRELARLGLAPVQVEVTRFDSKRLELRELRVGARAALAIETIDADYTLGDLWRGRVSALRVSGVQLTGEIDAQGAHFGGLERSRERRGQSETPAPTTLRLPTLPTTELRIDAAHAEIATGRSPRGSRWMRRIAPGSCTPAPISSHRRLPAVGVLELRAPATRSPAQRPSE